MSYIHHRIGAVLAGGAACLVMLLSSANPALADITTFAGQVTLENQTNLSDVYFLYNGNDGAVSGAKSLGSNYGITSVPFFYSAPYAISSGYATALGIYTGSDSSTGIAVALNSAAASSSLGKSFESVFGVQESTVEGYLMNNDMDSLLAFLNTNQNSFINYAGDSSMQTGAIVDFSDGTNGGSITLNAASSGVVNPPVSTTPEPASYLLMSFGAALMVMAKLRRRLGLAR
ncbi:MAG: PEP-CTERM sorting domain-containing protein [Acidobacteriaceae bacterium]|nr:PEP-CTERM sorting domain-containing protein [Acidobacteriaceae bacterium]MBV9679105.1 PEP-CTERM sorting domain-containing protein [Acidobacteriaceae bacterium]